MIYARYYYRSASSQEVDFVLEGSTKQVIGVDVKAKSKVAASALQGGR